MSRKRSKTSPLLPILIVCAAIAIWIYDAYNQGKLNSCHLLNLQKNAKSTKARAWGL